MEVNRTSIGFTNFLRCLIFDCYNISISKKGKVKNEASKKIRETNGGQIKEQDYEQIVDLTPARRIEKLLHIHVQMV